MVCNSGLKIEEHRLIVMDKPTHEEITTQPLRTNIKQFKIAVTFLTGYNGIFSKTTKNEKFYFKTAIDDDDFTEITISSEGDELESVNKDIKRNVIEEDYFT